MRASMERSPRRKEPRVRIDPAKSHAPRPLIAAPGSGPRAYVSVFAQARALVGVAAFVVAPLGIFAGVVGACGGGPPVDPREMDDAGAGAEGGSKMQLAD